MGCYGAGFARLTKWNTNPPGPQNPTVIRLKAIVTDPANNPYAPSEHGVPLVRRRQVQELRDTFLLAKCF